jgi:hypothetical protein
MSKIEVNQISSQCGSTLTIGQSGDTIQLACGATQTGFGRTGTVDWDTTAKTASFTAVSGTGYFVNTTSGAITLTLPASPSAGDIVAFKDYAFTFATNNLTVDGNGSPIGGVDGTILPTYSTNGTSKTFIYVDGTKGWLVTNESTDTSQESNTLYVTATGGTITCCGDYKIHTFTGPGTFTVTCAGNACGSNTVDYLVVAGGAGGGWDSGGGGGAGGFRESSGAASGCYSISPLGACVSALPVSVTGYPITVGAAGSGATSICDATNGSNSIFSTITSTGGGAAGSRPSGPRDDGSPGGSGGGGAADGGSGASGNTPPVSPPQGNNGGNSPVSPAAAGGGGGAGGVGGNGTPYPSPGTGGNGGSGVSTSISASSTPYSGGGGGGSAPNGPGGNGGGVAGHGTNSPSNPGAPATNGTTNRGEGGGGGDNGSLPAPNSCGGANGGSGIVIIRYKYQ